MSDKQELANWLFANQDKQGTPEFEDKKAQFKAADAPPTGGKIIVPPRGKSSVEILQDEYIKEYERPAKTPEEQSRREANLGALTRELATLKAQPPAVERQGPPVEEESSTLSGLRRDIGQIETKRQEQQPDDQRLNAQVAGAVVGAVPGAVQQASIIKDMGKRGMSAAMDAVAGRVRGPSTVADLANDVIAGEMPQGVTPAALNQTAARFYQQFPHELENGNMAAGGRGTYAYARSFQLPVQLAMQAVDLKDAQRLIQDRRAGTLAAQAAMPGETLVERPNSGVLTLGDRREPRARLIIGGDQPSPPPPPQQPRSALPPGAPLTGAPQPRLTAGVNPFQPGRPALLQAPPVETPIPSMEPGAPPPGVQGGRREPTMGMPPSPVVQGPAMLGEAPRPTSAARAPVRSALDAVTGMFARNVTEPAQRVLGALPIIPKTLGGMQIGGGGAEMATGLKQGDIGKVGTGSAEMLGGGLSMFGRTAPAGMTISILTELYRNARTPEDRQKIMDTLNKMMFGQQQTM